jgi:methylmalonyl-CoA epimerase
MSAEMRRIDHVGIAVRSIDASLAYYMGTLGLALVADGPRPDGMVRLAYLEAGDTTLQLVEPLRAGPVADFIDRHGEGLHHVCFEVDDLEGVLAAVPGEDGDGITMGGLGCRVAFLKDRPNSVLIELSEAPGASG